MNSKEEFKKRFETGEFDELLKNVTSPEDVVRIASDLGYDISLDDVLSTDLEDDALASVAGGKGETINNNNITIINDSFSNNQSEKTNLNGNNNKAIM